MATGRTASPARRALLFALSALFVGAPCCGGGMGGPASQLASLRVVSVRAEEPYAQPGDSVTFRMTYADALDRGADAEGPRDVQVTWLGGCVNPLGDTYLACFAQFQGVFQSIASGGMDPTGLFKQEVAPPELSGEPDAVSFDLKLPGNILMGAKPTDTAAVYSTAYLFFAICAGTVRPAAAESVTGFPLECIGEDGTMLGPDSYVAGYTQIFVFSDGRTNQNPPVTGLTLDGTAIGDESDAAPTVPRCAPAATTEQPQGCGMAEASDCTTFTIEALVDDVAEVDPESSAESGAPVKESIWVDYFADGGSFSGAKKLIHDPALGYREDHSTKWTPPGEAGLFSLWAVVHDARGGASVTRKLVRVE